MSSPDTISIREQTVVNSALEQGPKAMLILLTHSQANRLKKSVRDKRRVDIRRIDRHLSLVMWSAIATDAETIRRTVNAAYRLPFTDPFMLAALLAIAVFSAAFGGIALWSFLAYEPLDSRPLAYAEAWVAQGAAHITKARRLILAGAVWLKYLAKDSYCKPALILSGAVSLIAAFCKGVTAVSAGFKTFLLTAHSAIEHFASRAFQLALRRIIEYLEDLQARAISVEGVTAE